MHYGASHYTRTSQERHPWNDGRYPEWTTEIWQQIYAAPQADEWVCGADPTIELTTWFLDDDLHGICSHERILHLGHDWWAWEDHVRSLWQDQMNPDLPFDVHLVFPEPPRPTLEYHQAHVLVSQIRTDHKAVMLTAFLETNGPRRHLWRRAISMEPHVNRRDILIQVPVVRTDQIEVFWHEHLFGDQRQAIPHGAGIIVYYGLPAGTDERRFRLRQQGVGDINVLLAHHAVLHPPPRPLTDDPDIARDLADVDHDDFMDEEAPSERSESMSDHDAEVDPDSTWTTAIVFNYGGEAIIGRIQETHPELEHREVAHMLEIPPNRLIAIHRIHHPPDDLLESYQQAHIAQLLHDLPIGSLSKFVLLDVVFCYHLPILDVETVRQIKLMVTDITRSMLLRLTRLDAYCLEAGNPCLVHHNGRLMLSQLDSPLALHHGDYIKITVPPPPVCSSKDTRIAALAHYHGLSAAAYPHLERQMPEGFSVNQVPNPARHFNRLTDSPRASPVGL